MRSQYISSEGSQGMKKTLTSDKATAFWAGVGLLGGGVIGVVVVERETNRGSVFFRGVDVDRSARVLCRAVDRKNAMA